MKGLKFSLGDGGIKGFFIQHGEKVGAAVVLACAGFFFARGAGVEVIGENQSPAVLKKTAVEVSKHIAEDSTALIMPDRVPKRIFTKELQGRPPVESNPYIAPVVLTAIVPPQDEPRRDPVLFKPEKLEVVGVHAPLAQVGKAGAMGRLDTMDFAPKKKEAEKPVAPARPVARPRGGGAAGAADAAALGAGAPAAGGADAAAADGAGAGPAAADGMAGMMGPSRGDYLALSPHQFAKLQDSLPHVWRGNSEGNQSLRTKPVLKGQFVVGVKAVVRWREQWLEYKNAFEKALAYSPDRDVPQYLMFEAMVADVTDNPEMAVPDDSPLWKTVAYTDYERKTRIPQWAGVAKEIIDPDYIDPNLTMPVPPICLIDYGPFALHALVPEFKPRAAVREEPRPEASDKPDLENPVPVVGGGPGPGGRPGMLGGAPGGAAPGGVAAGAMPARGAVDAAGAGGPGGGPAIAKTGEPKVPYKEVRFFDDTAVPGRSYRYKVRVYLIDPNNPASSSSPDARGPGQANSPTALSDQIMAPEVVQRLEKVRASGKGIYWRATEWSEPSDVITVPKHVREVFAGGAEPSIITYLDQDKKFERTEPHGEVVASLWDAEFAAHIPLKQEVQRGSVLNVTLREGATEEEKPKVLHPYTWAIHILNDYDFEINAMVLDLRGGEKLPSSDRDEDLRVPGEYLVMDSEGNLRVQNEIDDLETYRMRMFVNDGFGPLRKAAGNIGVGPGMGPGMDPGGMMDAGGMDPAAGAADAAPGADAAAGGDFGLR